MVQEGTAASKCLIVTYGMGVYWSAEAAKQFPDQVGILDLRTLVPLDENLILDKVREYNRVLVVTEESPNNSFAQALAGRISQKAFQYLDAPVDIIGSVETPAIPLNATLEATLIPNGQKVAERIHGMLNF